MAGWLAVWLAVSLGGCLIGWLSHWLSVSLAVSLGGCLIGCLTDRLSHWLIVSLASQPVCIGGHPRNLGSAVEWEQLAPTEEMISEVPCSALP